MSANSFETVPGRSHSARQLARYLRAELERTDGDLYVNGDRLATILDLPPEEIDHLLRELSRSTSELSFSVDTAAPRTVWRVSRS